MYAMKNPLLITCFIFFSFAISAQLSRSEVYDFSVGNYYGIEFKANGFNSSTMYTVRYEMFHILTKQLYVAGDSVVYSAQRQTYIPSLPNGSGGSTSPSLVIDTLSFSHIDLSLPYSPDMWDLTFGNYTTRFWDSDTNACYYPLDTLIPSPLCITNSGQAKHFGMHLDVIDSCGIEPYISDYYVYSNAGGPYGGKENPGDPTYQNYLNELFYVVHNGVECGSFPSFFLNVEENQSLYLEVFPNPVQNQLTLVGAEVIKSSVLYSSDGKIVNEAMLWNGTQLDVSNLDSGIYFLKISDETGKIGQVRFVK